MENPLRGLLSALRSTRLAGIAAQSLNVMKDSRPAQPQPAADMAEAFIRQIQKHENVTADFDHLRRELNAARPYSYRVLFVTHEMTLTGAPLVLLNFAETVRSQGNQAVLLCPYDGPLREEAERRGVPAVIIPGYFKCGDIPELAAPFNLVVACTIFCDAVIRALSGKDIPVLWWIHEAKSCYQSSVLLRLPDHPGKNIFVYSVCDYAKDVLRSFRQDYTSGILPYYMEDFAGARADPDFHLPPHPGKKVFTLVGSLEQRKGQDILASAIRMLPPETLGQCFFVIVSGRRYEPFAVMMEQLVRDYPENAIWYELLNRDAIAALYRETDCLICASRDDPMPCVITEALCVGKPVISSSQTGYAPILRERRCGLVYGRDDPAALARTIRQLLAEPYLYAELQANTRATYVAYFTPAAFEEKAARILNRLILHMPEEEPDPGAVSLRDALALSAPKTKRVSAVIPLTASASPEALLCALEAQKRLDSLEILTVDAGLPDAAADSLRAHRVKRITLPAAGFTESAARNAGAAEASGDVLVFLSQSAIPQGDDFLSALITPLASQNIAAASPAAGAPPDADLSFRAFCAAPHAPDEVRCGLGPGSGEPLREAAYLNPAAIAVPRTVFSRFLFRDSPSAELDLGIRLLRSGCRLMTVSQARVLHSEDPSAGDLFRRTLAQASADAALLFAPVAGTASEADMAGLICQGYAMAQQLFALLLNGKYLGILDFAAQTELAFAKIRALPLEDRYRIPDVSGLSDPALRSVSDAVCAFRGADDVLWNDLLDQLSVYWSDTLYPFVRKDVRWTPGLPSRVVSAMDHRLAVLMARELARLDPACAMAKAVR